MIRVAILIALSLTGCGALDDATQRLAAAAEPDDDQGEAWCEAFTLAIESCDVDHYADGTAAPKVVVGCTGVALAAAGFDVEADPGGATALAGALLGAYGYSDPSDFESAVEACR
jgi:hypothetical protein